MKETNMSKEVAEIISNPTCRKIIECLKNNPASETDISRALNLPASTVNYNIQKLLKNGFIDVKDFMWSTKGNKINIYKNSDKMFVFSHQKPKYLENKMKVVMFSIIPILLVVSIIMLTVLDINLEHIISPETQLVSLEKFESCSALNSAFKEAQSQGRGGFFGNLKEAMVSTTSMSAETASADTSATQSTEYSKTNVQVEGVDEADIVKTDGKYIYTLSKGRLIIARAYPIENAEILSELDLGDFEPNEIFIDDDKLLIFGSTYEQVPMPMEKGINTEYYPYSVSLTTVKLYDISDRKNPNEIRKLDFEGNYVTSRKIGEYAYFVINSYPNYYVMEANKENNSEDIIPLYRDTAEKSEELKAECGCGDVKYFNPIDAQSFITIVSMSMKNENAEINKNVIVGSGQNVYASLDNIFVAQVSYNQEERTVVHKFSLDKDKVEYKGNGQVSGHILNQFSMDEYDNHFRIATTISGYSDNKDTSTNNIYILNEDLNITGFVDNIAPGESIYSVRFMGKRAYMVTFRHVDPLFVIDLSDVNNPTILGKLKIPGYSDYLHPYDENHLIGIGKEVDESIDADKVHTEGAVYYTAIQGVKISIFDVSDVSNPIEMYKEVIGDRGTESLATSEHKAFLFDKDKNLLVVPMTVAELKEGQSKSEQGEFNFNGAYVYKLTLENGFELKGKITHYNTTEAFEKSGYYFYGGDDNILRSLFIENILYTLSNNKIKANRLDTLEELKTLAFNSV